MCKHCGKKLYPGTGAVEKCKRCRDKEQKGNSSICNLKGAICRYQATDRNYCAGNPKQPGLLACKYREKQT